MTSQAKAYKSPLSSSIKHCPLYFANKQTDRIAKNLTSFGNTYPQRIVYMGPRYTSAHQAFKAYGYRFDYQLANCMEEEVCEQSQLYSKVAFRKYPFQEDDTKEKCPPVRSQEYRLFRGMNPTTSKSDLHFDADFECGNLDLVVKVSEMEYDLFMRVDSNTRGHTCWFFFKVSQIKPQQTVRFNIFNFSKQDLMYSSGQKVTMYSSKKRQWFQGGEKIEFAKPKRTYYYDNDHNECLIGRRQSSSLTFQYTFSSEDYMYFASCLPYSYSYLLYRINQIRQKNIEIVEIDTSNQSTGGLKIPILSITNKQQSNVSSTFKYRRGNPKPTCLIIGRLHPGEVQSNWVLEGFIDYLCSPSAKYLRDQIIFKIVPMVNVDGVVLGNFRTGIIGRDLNRMFKNPDVSKEVSLVRELAYELRPFIFLDFHGHCSKKYIFSYGPDYSIDHKFFIESRLLPKLIQKSSKAFRYYSCSFRISQGKKKTARAIMLYEHEVIYSYTIQTSMFAYGPKSSEKVFTQAELLIAGGQFGEGFGKFVKMIFTLPKRLQARQQLRNNGKTERREKNDEKLLFNRHDKSQQGNVQAQNLVAELIDDEKEINNSSLSEQESDFEAGQDYTDQELILLFKDNKESQQQIKKALRHQKKNSELPVRITKTEKSLIDSSDERSNQKRPEIKRQQVSIKPIKVRIYKQMPCVTPFLNRSTLSRNKCSSIFISHDDLEANRIQYKLSSNLLQQTSLEDMKNIEDKVTLVKPASIQFSPVHYNNGYEPFSESKNKERQRKAEKLSRRQAKHKVSLDARIEVNRPILPMLGRPGLMNSQEARSMVQQIIEKHERLKANKTRRQLKIMPI